MDVKINSNKISIYARLFDESSPSWNKTSEYNMFFLQAMENYLNDLLNSRGHVFLNDVYDKLNIKRTSVGAITGWILSSNNNFIQIRIEDADNGSLMLDFNVDGIIYDKI